MQNAKSNQSIEFACPQTATLLSGSTLNSTRWRVWSCSLVADDVIVFVVAAEVVVDHVAAAIAHDDVGEVVEKLYITFLIFYSNLNWIWTEVWPTKKLEILYNHSTLFEILSTIFSFSALVLFFKLSCKKIRAYSSYVPVKAKSSLVIPNGNVANHLNMVDKVSIPPTNFNGN